MVDFHAHRAEWVTALERDEPRTVVTTRVIEPLLATGEWRALRVRGGAATLLPLRAVREHGGCRSNAWQFFRNNVTVGLTDMPVRLNDESGFLYRVSLAISENAHEIVAAGVAEDVAALLEVLRRNGVVVPS